MKLLFYRLKKYIANTNFQYEKSTSLNHRKKSGYRLEPLDIQEDSILSDRKVVYRGIHKICKKEYVIEVSRSLKKFYIGNFEDLGRDFDENKYSLYQIE